VWILRLRGARLLLLEPALLKSAAAEQSAGAQDVGDAARQMLAAAREFAVVRMSIGCDEVEHAAHQK
jgi:hypothetical protein